MEQQSQVKKLLLGYWACRGRGQGIRYLLEYLGLPYEEKRYSAENWQEWFAKDKQELPAKYPNLAYLKDGEKCITESETIYLYLCKKADRKDLLGKTDDDFFDVSTSRWFVYDLIYAVTLLAYNKDFETVKDATFNKEIFPRLDTLSKNMGDKEFLNGYLTYVDFPLYEFFDMILVMRPDTLDKYENLKAYHKRFQEQKFMKDYIASEKFIRRPFFGPAVWNPQD